MEPLTDFPAEVHYGAADRPLPDWRREPDTGEADDEDDELSDDERDAVAGVLGFDPADIGDGAEGGEGDQPATFRRR